MKICLANRPFQNRGVELSFIEGGVKIQLLEALRMDHFAFDELARGRTPD